MIHTDGNQYNFDRIMRVTLYDTKSARDSKSGQFFQFEYCPLDTSGLYNARIDATITYMPEILIKNKQDGYTAKISLYNVSGDVYEFISRHTWLKNTPNKEMSAYYNSRIYVVVEAGYWEPSLGSGKERNYNMIFSGFLNSSTIYRKNVDSILDLFCFSRQITTAESQKVIKDERRLNDLLSSDKEIALQRLDEDFQNQISTAVSGNFVGIAKEIIKNMAVTKMPAADERNWLEKQWDKIRGRVPDFTTPVSVESKDRTTDSWIALHFIEEPTDKVSPEKSENIRYNPMVTVAETLSDFANNRISALRPTILVTKDGYATQDEFVGKMQELCDIVGLKWTQSPTNNEGGKTHFYFWYEGDKPVVATQDGTVTKTNIQRTSVTVKITNFQNFTEVPVIDGSGNFKMKMLFNPELIPGKNIELVWDEKALSSNAQISQALQGINATASTSSFWPAIQEGKYSSALRVLASDNGSVFNHPFLISYVTHTLSTHTDKWHTEAKTKPGGL